MANQEQENQDNIVDAEADVKEAEPDTGELPRVRKMIPDPGKVLRFRNPFRKRSPDGAAASIPVEQEEEDDYRRQRKLIESFDEDYLSFADRVKLGAVSFVGFAIPVVLTLAVGYDIGRYFAPSLGLFSAYSISYALEGGIAALTIRLGQVAKAADGGIGYWVKLALTGIVWAVASAGSALLMYTIATDGMSHTALTGLGGTAIAVRTIGVALGDVMSVCILFWRGKSLQKHLRELAQKSHAIRAVNEGELEIDRAREQAKERKRENEQYLEARERQFQVVNELQEMTNQALLDVARRNLLKGPDDGNNRRIGRF